VEADKATPRARIVKDLGWDQFTDNKQARDQRGAMAQTHNPYGAPEQLEPSSSRKWRPRGLLLASACFGIIVGSYISAELDYFHHDDQVRTQNDILSRTFAGVVSSPVSMSFGIHPTLKFYSSHGFLVFPGIVLALVGTYFYKTNKSPWALLTVFIGCILWAHNNYLSFSALMSV
jgi:hypothetical protein